MTSEIKVDTISEQTSANGVTIDGLTIKDGNIIGDVALAGTTPTFTIGDAGAEDAALIFDGNAVDYYIALDDSADNLIIGSGSTVGSNSLITIDSDGDFTFTKASSGASATSGTVLTVEDDDNTELSILGGSSSVLAINFGHSGDNDEGKITFNTTAGSEDLQLVSSKEITLDAAGDITLDAGGGDIRFKDGGTEIAVFENSSSDLQIKAAVQDKDMIFRGNDGGSGINALVLDMSDAGTAKFNHNIKAITDDGFISSGASDDLIMFHDGTDSKIFNSTGDMIIDSADSDKDLIFKGSDGGSVITALTLDMSAAGLAIFNAGLAIGGTGAANTLDDYEEGTWTATNTGGFAGDPTATCHYTKIGRVVYIASTFNFASANFLAENIVITGLPFATATDGDATADATLRAKMFGFVQRTDVPAEAVVFWSVDTAGGTTITLRFMGDNASTGQVQGVAASSVTPNFTISGFYFTDS